MLYVFVSKAKGGDTVVEHITKQLPDFNVMGKGKIDAKFINYARTKFTNISDVLIQRNYSSI